MKITKVITVLTLLATVSVYANVQVYTNQSDCFGPFKNEGDVTYLNQVVDRAKEVLASQCLAVYRGMGKLRGKERIQNLDVSSGAMTCVSVDLTDYCHQKPAGFQ